MSYSEYFARSALEYRAHRPTYPGDLFDYLVSLLTRREWAWDCAAGSGQASVELSRRFRGVLATDVSLRQLRQADGDGGFHRSVCTAEEACLATGSVDLVTVTQALHWLDLEAFYAEVRRVLRPGGALAAVSYSLCAVTPEVDEALWELYDGVLGEYWHPHRRSVDNGYADFPFPFPELGAPEMAIVSDLTGHQFLSYLGTWSAVCRARDVAGTDPLESFAGVLAEVWGPLGTRRTVEWPLRVRVGRTG